MRTRLLLLALVASCGGDTSTDPGFLDGDGDGLTPNQGDCDDADPSIGPNATEVWYDGIDQDCDGNDDDRDEDGVAHPEDCEDEDPAVFPGAPEVWGDDLDVDCDGSDFGGFVLSTLASNGTGLGGPSFASRQGAVLTAVVAEDGGAGLSAMRFARYDHETLEQLDTSAQAMPDSDQAAFGTPIEALLRNDFEGIAAVSILTHSGNARASLMQDREGGGWTWSGWGPSGVFTHFAAMDAHDDGSDIVVLGCGPQVRWVRGTIDEWLSYENLDNARHDSTAQRCAVRGVDALLVEGGAITAVHYDGGELLVSDGTAYPGPGYLDVQWEDDDHLMLTTDSALEFVVDGQTHEVLPSLVPALARYDIDPDGTVFAVVADAAGDLALLYGDPAATMTEVALPAGIALDALDVEATRSALFIGARTGDEVLVSANLRP